jgi:hypothetical protein
MTDAPASWIIVDPDGRAISETYSATVARVLPSLHRGYRAIPAAEYLASLNTKEPKMTDRPINGDFETHPIGTGDRLTKLEAMLQPETVWIVFRLHAAPQAYADERMARQAAQFNGGDVVEFVRKGAEK